MIRLVALDIDGTLLNSDHKISERNKDAVRRAIKEGVKIVLLSGRNFLCMQQYVEELELKDLTISLNGAYILDGDKREAIHDLRVERDAASDIIKAAEDLGIHINYYHDEAIACGSETDYSREYSRITGVPIAKVGSIYEYNKTRCPNKMLLIGQRELLDKIRAWVEKYHDSRVNFFYSNPMYLEITHKNVSKGQALAFLADYYGFTMDEVMAVGDGENDLSMIKAAGIGVAMENALDEVKAAANFITLSNNRDGVAYAIEKLVLKTLEEN